MMRYVLFFLFSGVIGWFIDAGYCSLASRKFYIQTYFKRIPFSPIWATGGLLVALLVEALEGQSLWMKIPIYFVSLNGLEYIAGTLALQILRRRVWDYSKSKYHLNGHIDLLHSCYWLGCALVFDALVYQALSAIFVRLLLTNTSRL